MHLVENVNEKLIRKDCILPPGSCHTTPDDKHGDQRHAVHPAGWSGGKDEDAKHE